MNIKTISYRRTINLGNYESATFEATAELTDGFSPESEAERLADYVIDQLQIEHGRTVTRAQR